MKKYVSQRKLVIFLVLIGIVIGGRLALDTRSDAYESAITALYQSQAAREFVGGNVMGTMLVGLSNKSYTSMTRGSRTTLNCASRLFLVRGEGLGFVEVTMQADAESVSKWKVREVLPGWFTPSSVPCVAGSSADGNNG